MSTPNCMVYGETGRFELDVLISKRAVLYWYKCVTGCGMKWSDHMYCMMYSLYVHSSTTTLDNIYSQYYLQLRAELCVDIGRSWYNYKHVKGLSDQVSFDQFIQKWRSEVANSSKCLRYRIYKQDFGLERYL